MKLFRPLGRGFADLARPSSWIAGLLLAAAMVACELVGLDAMRRVVDSRIFTVLVLLGAGSCVGSLLAIVMRPWVTFVSYAARAGMHLVLLLASLVAGNSFTLWLWHMVERFDYGEPDSAGHWLFAFAASAAVNTFLFISISLHVLMPQALVPIGLMALWLTRRPATLPGG